MVWHFISIFCLIVGQVSSFENDDARLNITTNSTSSAELVEGTVEIYYSGEWYPLCALLWEVPDGNVTCRSVGYENGVSNVTKTFQHADEYYMRYSGFECNGTESSLRNCKHETPIIITNDTCSYGIAVAICIKTPPVPTKYALIFGVTGGCIAFVALCAGAGYFVYRWKKRRNDIYYQNMINTML